MSVISSVGTLTRRASDYLIIFLLYTLSFGLSLLNKGIYQDDWILFDVSPSVLLQACIDNAGKAGYVIGYIHIILLSLGRSVFIYRALTFLLFLLSGFFLYRILEHILEIEVNDRFLIVLLFILLPFNNARISLACIHYSLCYFVFYLAFFIAARYSNRIFARVVSLFLFFFSFLTNSLLLFYIIFLLFLLYKEREKINSANSLLRIIFNYADYLILPALFWIVKGIFFVSSGLYANYNKVTISTILTYPFGELTNFTKQSFIDLLNILPVTAMHIIAITFLFLVFFFIPAEKAKLKREGKDIIFLIFGLFSYAIAIFPYLITGNQPSFYDMYNRHQLLMPLGASFVLYYGVKIILAQLRLYRNTLYIMVFSMVLIFTTVNVKTQILFMKDWYKQLSIMENIKDGSIMRNNTTFKFFDNARQYNANGRDYRFYEYSGLMKRAFNDEIRFGISESEFATYKTIVNMGPYFTPFYSMKDYEPKDFQYAVHINPGSYPLSYGNCIKLRFSEMFDVSKYNDCIKNIIKLDYTKL